MSAYKYQSYQKEYNPYLEQSQTTGTLQRSVRAFTYSTPNNNVSQRVIGSPSSQRSNIIIQQPVMNLQPIPSLPPQNLNVYYSHSLQNPIYRLYNQPTTVYTQPEVRVSTGIEYQEIEHVPSIHEVHHVNRPINVISMDELEGPWRSKKILLEKQLLELQLMVKRGPARQVEVKEIVIEDEGKIQQLSNEIERLKEISRENDAEIQKLEELVQDAEYNVENAEESCQDQIEEQNRELARWKKKFSDLNKRFHDVEEEITMTEAQIESIQKRRMYTTSSIKTTQRTQQRRESEIRRSNYSNRNY